METESKPETPASHYLWSKEAPELMTGIFLAAAEKTDSEISETKRSLEKIIEPAAFQELTISSQTTCSTCGAEFNNVTDQREHFKSDWHRFNLKQKLKGLPPVTEEQFEEVSGDISSISGTGSSDDSSSDDDSGAEDDGWKQRKYSLQKSVEVIGSDTDDESYHIEGVGRRHPRVFLKNVEGCLLSIYRCVIHGKKNKPDAVSALIDMVHDLPKNNKWAMFLTAGGHFAGAIFDGEKTKVHKTFHRYVVRAKRGTAQSSRDKQGNAPKSGGASLRRYNEAALTQEIQELIKNTWEDDIKDCSRIFLRAPSFNRQIFFSGKSAPLDKNDTRIRMIPFQTRRPTFKELLRVHEVLAEIKIHDKDSSIHDYIQSAPKKHVHLKPKSKPARLIPDTQQEDESSSSDCQSDADEASVTMVTENVTLDTSELAQFGGTKPPRRRAKRSKTKAQPKKKEIETAPAPVDAIGQELSDIRNDMYTACKVADKDKLEACIGRANAASEKSDTDGAPGQAIGELLNTAFGGEKHTTLLHVACKAGSSHLITVLLNAGADPATKDHQGNYPYVVAANKEVRNEFRRFMAKNPDTYDYVQAQVPGPLTDEMENDKKAKEAEKKKAQRKARKERQKEQKAIECEQREEEREKQRFLNLSEREKRALAAERRLVTQKVAEGSDAPVSSRCWQCADDITGKVPFEYYDYKFCSPKCLKEHKLSKR